MFNKSAIGIIAKLPEKTKLWMFSFLMIDFNEYLTVKIKSFNYFFNADDQESVPSSLTVTLSKSSGGH